VDTEYISKVEAHLDGVHLYPPFLLSLSRLHHAARALDETSSLTLDRQLILSFLATEAFWRAPSVHLLRGSYSEHADNQLLYGVVCGMAVVCVEWLWYVCVVRMRALALCGCVSSILAGRNLGPFLLFLLFQRKRMKEEGRFVSCWKA